MRLIKLNIQIFLFVLFCILIINLVFFTQINRFKHLTENLILNGGFELSYKHWINDGDGKSYLQEDCDGTHLKLDSGRKGEYVAISQKIILKDNYSLLSFEGDVEVKFHLVNSSSSYPAIYLAYEDSSNGIIFDDIKIISLFKKEHSFKTIRKFIQIPEDATSIFFVAVVEKPFSSLKLNNLKLFPVIQESSCRIFQIILLIIDLIFFCFSFILIFKQKRVWIIAVTGTLIMIGMVTPNFILRSLVQLIPLNNFSILTSVDMENFWSLSRYPYIMNELFLWQLKSWTHFISFFILSFSTFFVYRDKNQKVIFSSLLLAGCFAEIVQSFTVSRVSTIYSLGLNIVGILTALIIINIVIRKKDNLHSINNKKPSLIIYLRSILFYIVFVLSIPPTAIFMWVLPLITPFNSWVYCRLWGRFINFALLYICKIKIEIQGQSVHLKEPVLIIANHTGPWETTCIMPFFSYDFTYVLKKELISWKYNFFSLGLRAIRPIAISREANSGDFSLMQKKIPSHFRDGRSVLIFPGGTRKALKESLDIPAGGSLLAKKLKCGIQPLFIDSESWSRGEIIKDYGLLYPGVIRLHFAPVITSDELKAMKTKVVQEKIINFYKQQLI